MATPNKTQFWSTTFVPRLRQRDAVDAVKWFNSRADAGLSDVAKDAKKIGGKRKALARPMIGDMYLYRYWAKHAATLPYWDMHPLVIPFEYHPTGFYACNLHYLPVAARYAMMGSLMKVATQAKGNMREKLAVSAAVIKATVKKKHFSDTVHMYLWKQMRSPFLLITPDEWRLALSVPVQKWVGGRPY